MKILMTMLIASLPILVGAQQLIYQDSVLLPGIYQSFEALQTNAPSLSLIGDIKAKKTGQGYYAGAGEISVYHLKVDRQVGKTIGTIHGFCDGKDIYLPMYPQKINQDPVFYKIQFLGIKSYLEVMECPNMNGVEVDYFNCKLSSQILDMENGKLTALDRKEMTKLLASDAVLLAAFEKDSEKKDKIQFYAYKFMGKNAQKFKPMYEQ